MLNRIFKEFRTFVFPSACLFCQSETDEHNDHCLICFDCQNLLQPLNSEELDRYHQNYLQDNFVSSVIGFQFDEVNQQLLHFVKYHQGRKLAHWLGEQIFLKQSHHFKDPVDAILPCPLHPRKFKEREFNQAELIADGLAEQLSIKVDTTSLRRTRYTKTQTRLNKQERMQNLASAFSYDINLAYSHIIILDDVITTGSTLNTIAECILAKQPDLKLTAVSFASPV